MNRILIWVGLGGMLGSMARYLIAVFMGKIITSEYPWSTFVANILGCLLIGLFYGLSQRNNWMTPELRIFLTTGFCGGFTTFSTFSFENIALLQTAHYGLFAVYSILSFGLGLLAVVAGLYLTRI